jgi:hypothetical protein
LWLADWPARSRDDAKWNSHRSAFFLRRARESIVGDLKTMNSTSPGQPDTDSRCENQENTSSPQRPAEPIDFGATGQLFNDLRDFLSLHPGLTADSVLKLTYFLFAICFPECAGIWPFAAVVSPDTVASSLLLRMFGAVSIDSLRIGEITLNALLTLPQSPRPSFLLIDQLATSREFERLLRIMSRPGSPILRKGQFHDVSIPTLVCTAEPLRDRWLLDQAVQITLAPTRGPLPNFESQILGESAVTLREKLVRYREKNLATVCNSHCETPHLGSPMREIANMLANSIVDDAALQRLVPMLLAPQDRDVRIRRTDSVLAIEIEAAFLLSHKPKCREALIGKITMIANGIFRERGENIELDPREMGNHLRAVGLFSERLGSAGRGIQFTKEVRRNLHDLARAYDVRTIPTNPCEFCVEAGLRIEGPPDRRE